MFGYKPSAQKAILAHELVLNPGHLTNWRYKRAKMDADGSTIARIGIWGTSIGEGYYAVTPTLTIAGVKTKTWAGLINEYYKAKYTDVGWGWQSGNGIGGYASTDEHYWTMNVGDWGETLSAANGGQCRISYGTLPNEQVTASFTGTGVDIVFEKVLNGASDVEILIDGISNQHVNLNTAVNLNTILKVTITGLADEAHTVSIINRIQNKICLVDGIRTIKGANGVQVMNYSRSGADTGIQFGTTVAAPDMVHKCLTLFDHDVAIFEWLLNDHGHSVGLSTYISRLKAYIAEALAHSMEVILVADGLQGQSSSYELLNASGETVEQYHQAMRQIAIDTGVCMIDTWDRWLPQVAKVSALYLPDGTHPNAAGHYDIYKAILEVLES